MQKKQAVEKKHSFPMCIELKIFYSHNVSVTFKWFKTMYSQCHKRWVMYEQPHLRLETLRNLISY